MFRCSAKTCDTLSETKGYCPACKAAYRKAWVAKHPGYHSEKKRQWALDNPERNKEIEERKYARRKEREGWGDRKTPTLEERRETQRQRWHRIDPEKRRARRAVTRAVVMGRLVRGPCERCGTEDNVEAHHDDYSKPLDVRWLCKEHHLEIHGKTLRKTGVIGLFD
jgi:hypothetical protein